MNASASHNSYRAAIIDLAVIAVGALVMLLLAQRFGLSEHLAQFLLQSSNMQSDQTLIVATYLMCAVFFFAVRRWREALEIIDVIERSARTDALTGLPNRRLFVERLREAMVRKRQSPAYEYAVLFLDFDRFKIVNDSLGHDIGDAMLKEIASRLCRELCFDRRLHHRQLAGHCVARLGGDEFVVLLTSLAERQDALCIAERLLIEFRIPLRLGDHSVCTTASIGVVHGIGAYDRPEEVIRDADSAMYEAKRTGKNRFVEFDESMHQRVVRRLKLENELRKTVNDYELCVAYQPIISLASGELAGVESLLRWTHSELGVIGPAEFISIAEESDLIHNLGEWVLRESCRQMTEWIDRLGPLAPEFISVNVSRKQFMQKDLPAKIKRVLEEEQLDPSHVQLEITEDAFGSDMNSAIEAMNAIRATGVRLAIDDFGAGFSNFAALRQFPIDVLKLDRSICSGIHDSTDAAALVHSLAMLVRNVGIKMVAEGVETARQVTDLRELGCQYGQGYYFSRPMTATAVVEYIRTIHATTAQVTGASFFANSWQERLEVFTPTDEVSVQVTTP